jgi:3-hydroxyacyl-CoA dehydrogenase/enoyl-CoA hydratase/carnithine racemase
MQASVGDRPTVRVERHPDGLVVLSFFVPGHRQNVLTREALDDLAAVLDAWSGPAEPGILVIRSARAGSFFAGADLGGLETLHDRPPEEIARGCDAGRGLFARLSARPWPTVAFIDGTCLGGGLELALACDLRIATTAAHTLLGLPEVKLGLLPGWGGTVLLPRLIGPGPAIELMTTGDPIPAREAERVGLVDACIDPAALPAGADADAAVFAAVRRLVDDAAAAGRIADRRRRMSDRIELAPAARATLQTTWAATIESRTGGHYPAPPAILATVLAGAAVPAAEAARVESRAFAALARSPESRQLLRVFRLGERNRRDAGIDAGIDAGSAGTAGGGGPRREPARTITAPAVVGAGIMGAGIAVSHLQAGFRLTLVDLEAAALAAAVPGILAEAAGVGDAPGGDPAAVDAVAGRLRTSVEAAAVAGSDLVIESVVERPDVKQRVLTDLERIVAADTIIATNTSTNPLARLAEPLERPERFCGLHFCNPVRHRRLVEVVRGPATSDATIAAVVAHAKRLGKYPIVVRDSPGFLVNRVLMPYLHEAVEMLREGVPATRIDQAARTFGMPLGPLELYDVIGLDTAFYAGLVMSAAYGDRIEAAPVVPALVKAGQLGCKSGRGFYRYPGTGPSPHAAGLDPAAAAIVSRYATAPAAASPTEATITDRLFLPMLLEALRAVDEEIVRDPRDVDLAVIHGLGFPAFRGGLFAWADSLGAAEAVRRLAVLAPLGPRMAPTERLRSIARSGGGFTA